MSSYAVLRAYRAYELVPRPAVCKGDVRPATIVSALLWVLRDDFVAAGFKNVSERVGDAWFCYLRAGV